MISSLSGLLNTLARGLRGRAPMLDAYLYSISTRNRICLYMCVHILSKTIVMMFQSVWCIFDHISSSTISDSREFSGLEHVHTTCEVQVNDFRSWCVPKVCIHGDSYTLKESVGWLTQTLWGHHCRDLWSDPGSLCSPCAEELIHPLTFRRIVKSSEELRSLQSQSNRNCPKTTGWDRRSMEACSLWRWSV